MINYTTLNEQELDKPIYRIFSIDYLLELFSTNELTLVKPKLWDDPFENLLINTLVENDITFANSYRQNIFAQCWTLHRETDAMWRIYSQNKDGIKIKTTPRKLLFAILKSDTNIQFDMRRSCFIGKVQYINKNDILEELKIKSNSLYDNSGKAISLLIKRIEFRHEKEVRIIFLDQEIENNSDTKKIKINSFDLFEEVVFDPRLSELKYIALSNYIKFVGYKGKISKSQLYNVPNISSR